MKGVNLIKRLLEAIPFEHNQASYAQTGEDRILHFLFEILGIKNPTYLDIGAHHPTYLSNTYLLYKQGARGVCIEPDPTLHLRIQKKRPQDVCLNVGIAVGGSRELEFYIFDNPTMNTFSKDIRDEQVTGGRILRKTLLIQVHDINEIITKHFPNQLHLVSLDTEGMDLAILQNLDFTAHRPIVVCVETLENTIERKLTDIIDFMISKNYRIFADTYLNSIFVCEKVWQARPAIASQLQAELINK